MTNKSRTFLGFHEHSKLIATSACILSLSALAPVIAHAGEDTKPVSLVCPKKPFVKSFAGDLDGYGYSLILAASKGKRMDMERQEAFGEMDMLLTSSYGLRKPLATITNKRAAEQVALVSQLALSGYVISAQMLYGVVKKEGLLPVPTLAITGNLLFTMIEPDDEDPALHAIAKRVRSADQGIAGIGQKGLPFARWLIRGYAYNDPVAVDAALNGFCGTTPSKKDTQLVYEWSRKSRLDPRSIVVSKEQSK